MIPDLTIILDISNNINVSVSISVNIIESLIPDIWVQPLTLNTLIAIIKIESWYRSDNSIQDTYMHLVGYEGIPEHSSCIR